jgi:hypothetical protein
MRHRKRKQPQQIVELARERANVHFRQVLQALIALAE